MSTFSYLHPFLFAAALVASACSSTSGGDDDDFDDVEPIAVCATGGAAYATVAEAVAAVPSGSVITLCPGTYAERVGIAGKRIKIAGAGADRTFLDAGAAGTALTITDGADVMVTGLTIQHGLASAPGGGISCADSELVVTDSALLDNRSTGGGGVCGAFCTVTIERTRFERNEGGAVGGGALFAQSTAEVLDSDFIGNSADDGGGVALIEGTATVRGNRFEGNDGRVKGGAIYVSSDATIDANVITGNRGGWTGAGIYVWMNAPIISANTIDANVAVEEGGGIYAHMSEVAILDNDITANTAGDDGGGVRLFTSTARVERNFIARNQVGDAGGGLKSSHLPSQIIDNQIMDNVAGTGGGLELDNDSSIIRGGVISGNRAGTGGGIRLSLWPWNGGVLDGVRIADNQASTGGGIALDNNFQPVTMRRLTVEGNRASRGGGIFTRATNLALSNSLLVGNVSSGNGGGLYLRTPDPWTQVCPCPPATPQVNLDFVVAHANVADTGAAIWTQVPGLSVESSIVTDHVGVAVAVADLAAPPRWRWNDTVPATFSGMADPTGVDGNLAVTPLFADPITRDFRLLAASHCVDAGDPALRDRDGSRADMGLFAGPDAP